MLASTGARADPESPLAVALLDVPGVILSGGALLASTVNITSSANTERVPEGWGLFGALVGTGACLAGIFLQIETQTSNGSTLSETLGFVALGSGVLDLGTLFWNARYARQLPNVSLAPRSFVDQSGARAYGAGLMLTHF
jgi:hypothetical protein